METEREKVWFGSDGTDCAGWHYRASSGAGNGAGSGAGNGAGNGGSNGGCVIMAAGFGVTKEAGTDLFARQFAAAGFSVLAFDYRHLGESGGQPRQVVRAKEQLADWAAAIGFAATLPEVDPGRLAAWAFSASGGYIFTLAARDPRLAAAIAQTPNADNLAAARNAARYQKPGAMLRFLGLGLLDVLGGLTGRAPRLVPLAAEPGTVAVVTTPDSVDGDAALGKSGEWQAEVAARSALRLTMSRPGRVAPRVRCPLLVVVADQDTTALAGPAIRAARRAPGAELVRLPGGHYAPFLEAHEEAAAAEVEFLRRVLLGEPGSARPAVAVAAEAPRGG